jgi:hypothetical protein
MGCRGVHFAISDKDAKRLLTAEDDDELGEIVGEIEEAWEDAFETDKAWDAMHRCFADGTLEDGTTPLSKVFFGARTLNTDDDYFVVLATPEEVRAVAIELEKVTEAWLRGRYFELPFPDYQGEKSGEDWDYTWGNFEGMPQFYRRAADAGKHVVFTVSQ